MRLCNLFLLPAAGESSPWKSEGAAGRASSGAKRPLLAGLAAPRVWRTLLVSHAADKVTHRRRVEAPAPPPRAALDGADEGPVTASRASSPGKTALGATNASARSRTCPALPTPPEEPHAEAAVPSLRPARAGGSRTTARHRRGLSGASPRPHGAHPSPGGDGMPVGAECVPPGVLPGRGGHRGGGDTERTWEKQKAPSPVDGLARALS